MLRRHPTSSRASASRRTALVTTFAITAALAIGAATIGATALLPTAAAGPLLPRDTVAAHSADDTSPDTFDPGTLDPSTVDSRPADSSTADSNPADSSAADSNPADSNPGFSNVAGRPAPRSGVSDSVPLIGQGSASEAGRGWLRVAHFSPDTPAVDLSIVSSSGDESVLELDRVAFGTVSGYIALESGRYRLELTEAGSAPNSRTIFTRDLRVRSGVAETAAVTGGNADLDLTEFSDTISTPAVGSARVRFVNVASTRVPFAVTDRASGSRLVDDAVWGVPTQWSTVAAGPWSLAISSPPLAAEASVTLRSGSSATVFLVDNSAKGITAVPVVDSAAAAIEELSSGIQAGGGWLASRSADATSRDERERR